MASRRKNKSELAEHKRWEAAMEALSATQHAFDRLCALGAVAGDDLRRLRDCASFVFEQAAGFGGETAQVRLKRMHSAVASDQVLRGRVVSLVAEARSEDINVDDRAAWLRDWLSLRAGRVFEGLDLDFVREQLEDPKKGADAVAAALSERARFLGDQPSRSVHPSDQALQRERTGKKFENARRSLRPPKS